jgi:hypothetical protein
MGMTPRVRSHPALSVLALLLSGGLATVQGQNDIHKVDFRNFTYQTGVGGEKIKVVDGKYHRDAEDDRLYFEVRAVAHGDLTGDGKDEAVVTTLENTGGTGQFTDVLVFTMRGGTLELLGALGVGDRADGGVHDARIADGQLVVERYGQENSGACCPEYIERSTLAVRGDELVEVRKPERLAYQVYDSDKGPGPQRVRFLPGSSGATLSGTTNTGEAYVIGARAGQAMRMELDTGDAKASAALKGPNGRSINTLRPGETWDGTLPASGDYTIAITSATGKDSADAYYTLDLEIR